VVSLRDVHADNLIWRAERTGADRVGLLDFQDALVLPDGYDLASLLDDPRRRVPEAWRAEAIGRYAADRRRPPVEMAQRVAVLSVLRNLRILGIFRRLARDEGRPGYASYLPRTRDLIARGVAHPGLEALRAPVAEVLHRSRDWQEDMA
jgi:aminoglycoside/choline kinase family phosphotransferase